MRITPDGLQAVERLSNGDMRRCLNIMQAWIYYQVNTDNFMQATSMAFGREINEGNVYACTGNPQPRDIEHIMDSMLNSSFDEAFASTFFVFHSRGFFSL